MLASRATVGKELARILPDRVVLDRLFEQRNETERALRQLQADEAKRRDPLVMTDQMIRIDIRGKSSKGKDWRNVYAVD